MCTLRSIRGKGRLASTKSIGGINRVLVSLEARRLGPYARCGLFFVCPPNFFSGHFDQPKRVGHRAISRGERGRSRRNSESPRASVDADLSATCVSVDTAASNRWCKAATDCMEFSHLACSWPWSPTRVAAVHVPFQTHTSKVRGANKNRRRGGEKQGRKKEKGKTDVDTNATAKSRI